MYFANTSKNLVFKIVRFFYFVSRLPHCCFTAALLLLYCCFTASLLVYCWFTAGLLLRRGRSSDQQ
jgi:hypothetical protein